MAKSLLILSFPLVLTVGIALIPVVADYGDHELATEAASQSTRWVVGHLIAACGFGLAVLSASLAVQHVVGVTSKQSWWISVLVLALGAGLLAAGLGADGIGAVAAQRGSGSSLPFFEGSSGIVPLVFFVGSTLYTIGQIGVGIGARNAKLLNRGTLLVVILGAVLFASAGAIPSGYGLYVVAAMAWVTWGPIAYAFREH